MRVKEAMSTKLETISPQDSAVLANELMWRKQIHHLIVMDGNMMVGLISDTDLGGANADTIPDNLRVADAMQRRVFSVDPNATLKEAANLMREHRVHSLPVMAEHQVVGIITSTDLENIAKRGRAHAPFQGLEPNISEQPSFGPDDLP